MAKKKDPLSPESTPTTVKQGKQLSKLAPTLLTIVLGLIVMLVLVAIMRRGPAAVEQQEEKVTIVAATETPIGDNSVGEIEAYKEKEPEKAPTSAEADEIAKMKEQIKMVSAAKQQADVQENVYWEKYKENQLKAGEERQKRLLAAVMAPSTVTTDGAGDNENGDAAPADPYADLKASMQAKLGQPGVTPAGYNGNDYNAMTQQMIENSLAMAGVGGGGGPGGDQNMTAAKDDFFNKSFSEGNYNDLPFQKVKLKSMYTLKEGDLIDGIMISGINSTLPGKIIAHVAKDVYDSVTGKHLLIPQGTELVGRYSDAIAYAQDRVAFGWTRMNFENGDSINLGNMGGYDQEGYAGVKDKVDNHYFRLFGQIALISFFQAVPALINPTESESKQTVETATSTHQEVVTDADGNTTIVTLTDTNPVTTTKSSSSGGTDEFQSDFKDSYGALMAETGVALAKRNMSIQPTLRVRQGKTFKIIVTKDMVIPPSGI